jgi:hypothetical protein
LNHPQWAIFFFFTKIDVVGQRYWLALRILALHEIFYFRYPAKYQAL